VEAAAVRSLLRQQQTRLLLELVGRGKLVVGVALPQLIRRHQREQSLAGLVEQESLLVEPLPQQLLAQQLVNRLVAAEAADTSVLETSLHPLLLVLEQLLALAVRVVSVVVAGALELQVEQVASAESVLY
jgi:hypothetical protein